VQKLLAGTLVIASLLAPAVASAQVNRVQPTEGVRFGLGAGLTLPLGDYSTADKLGFHGMGILQMPLRNSPVHLRADVMFSTTSHKGGVSGSSRLIGGTFDALYHLGDRASSARPYVLGGLGLFNVHADFGGTTASSTNVALGLGGGVLFGIGATMHGFAEARFMDVFTSGGSTTFVPITVGLMFSGN
jgi:opacity protein-like surface antigen